MHFFFVKENIGKAEINIGIVSVPQVGRGAVQYEIKKDINYKLPQHTWIAFWWNPDVCQLSLYPIHLAVFDKGLFHVSGEKIYLFTALILQDPKKCMLPTALGLPENMSHRFVLALKVQDFSQEMLSL